MLTKLRIQNFKGWKDTQTITMAPITLFFGANSSGKSSIGQFLMMLKQTAESPDRKAVFNPGSRNSAVQLGSYNEMVFQRDTKNKIKFMYEWELPNKYTFTNTEGEFTCNRIQFNAEIGLNGTNKLAFVHSLNYELANENTKFLSINMLRKSESEIEYEFVYFNDKGPKQKVPFNDKPFRFYGILHNILAQENQNEEFKKFIYNINFDHENLFHSMSYVGPLRNKPERLYSWIGVEPESVGYSGENTIAALLAAQSRKIGIGSSEESFPFEEIIAMKLKDMGLIENFTVNPISEQRQEYEVKVKTKGSNDWVDLPDVGFGISQVLPVLVQCFYAPVGSIIIMEQPEIHLHPAAQSILADVMIDIINSREYGSNGGFARNIQLIIETHSEHFLRRLQRRIAENAISQDKVSAYFANVHKTPAELELLDIDSYGNIRNWPQNFFGDEMEDISGQAEAAIKKRMEEQSQNTGE